MSSPFPTRSSLAPLARLAACSALALAAASCAEQRSRPNVLLITVDTLRADHVGELTPAMTALGQGGIEFTAAQSTSSWTLPSLASLMTSTYTSTHGCWDMDTELSGSFTTLAEGFAAAGYATSAVASHVFLAPKYGLHQGFGHYDTTLVKGLARSHEAISSPRVTRRSLAWLDTWQAADAGEPFLLWSHYFDPHEVYQTHKGFSEEHGTKTERQRYKGEVAFTDHHIGELLAGLEERGLGDDTIVVLVADHGEEFGDHGATRHGHTLYEELTRVPLRLRLPAELAADLGIEQGRAIGDTVSVVDVLPTLHELCDVAGGDPTLQAGSSLVPLMAWDMQRTWDERLDHGPKFTPLTLVAERWRGESMTSPIEGTSLSKGDWTRELVRVNLQTPPALLEVRLRKGRHADAVVWGPVKLVRWQDGRRELFDLARDAAEQVDLAAARPDLTEAMEVLLDLCIEDAAALGAHFDAAGKLELSAEELRDLADLGYVDGDEAEPR
ncbi:MAG: sulfatase [Planctomycetota bacterium]|nr:sulfatase [Planctomycetota bacterium]